MENQLTKKALSEDWLALILGLVFFVLSLGVFGGADILGWGIKTGTWADPAKALSVVSKTYAPVKGEIVKIDGQKVTLKTAAGKEETLTVKGDTSRLKVGNIYEKSGVSGGGALFFTFLAMLFFTTIGALALRANIPKFIIGFTVIFWLSYLCWFAGHYAHIAATKNDFAKFGISWSISMTGEFGFIIALVLGLLVGNFLQIY